VLASAQSKDVAAVIADGVYLSGADVFENINRAIVGNRKMNIGLRAIALIARCPGIPTSAALVYYLRTGIWLGLDMVNVLPYAAQIHIPILFISGSHDWIVPTDQVRKVMAAVPGQKSLLTFRTLNTTPRSALHQRFIKVPF
jgi:pimeloyl-ACP methyl ester carboxylesterase